MRTVITAGAAVVVGLAALGAWQVAARRDRAAAPSSGKPEAQWGGKARNEEYRSAGYGWSIEQDTTAAVRQALSTAMEGQIRPVQIVLAAYTSQHSPERVAEAIRAGVGPDTAIRGSSSDYGIVTPDGYHCSPRGVVGVLVLGVKGMAVGVGSSDLDEAGSPEACGVQALERAKAAAGLTDPHANPSMVLMCPTYDGVEEKYVEAITNAVGGSVPILGGTCGGSSLRGSADCSAIANGKIVRKGLVVAVFRSGEPFAWAFAGGFDRTEKSGVVTASSGREILEIDGRPALDVYDEWAGGRMAEAIKAGMDLNKLAALYPMCRTVGHGEESRNLFVHAWPPADGLTTRRLVSSASLWKGDVVHFSEGSWNILLNRIGLLPQIALEDNQDMRMAGGLLICCEGVLKNIPESQRNQIAQLVNRRLGGAPWLGWFTWGEQGNFKGIGNFHGNLLSSLTLFPDDNRQEKK